MALSSEVIDNIQISIKNGFDKLNLLPAKQTRDMMAQAPPNPDPTKVFNVVNRTVTEKEIPVRIYSPFGEGPFPVICFYHGGGFVLMSLDTHDEICRQICDKTNCIVMSVDYRLAPEHPFPKGPGSSFDAANWLSQHAKEFNGIGERIAVAGDSAGGYMALNVAQQFKKKGIPLLAQFAAYLVTDHYSAHHASWVENANGYVLTATVMKWFWDNYVSDPALYATASILRSDDFSGMPPALIFTANYDPLRNEGKAYAEKLKAAGNEVTYHNYENIHGFFGLGTMGQEAMNEACDFLKSKLL